MVEQNQTSVEHTKFILLYFVEQNQTMPVEQNHTMPVEQTSVTRVKVSKQSVEAWISGVFKAFKWIMIRPRRN